MTETTKPYPSLWTPEEDAKILFVLERGNQHGDRCRISDELERSYGAIRMRAMLLRARMKLDLLGRV